MKQILPIIIIIFIVFIFFKPFLTQHLFPIPSDTIAALYYPFRDLYAGSYPRGVPFKNFLITDPVRQQYPWRNLSITLEKHFELPLWNPYSFSGAPLLANLQSAPLYPLNILFFVLPFPIAWSFLIVLQALLAGVFFYLYARNLKLTTISGLLGAVTFSFCGFFTAWMEWNTVVQTALWLPLILLSIDKVLTVFQKNSKFKIQNSKLQFKIKNEYIWSFIFLFSIACAFLAGHLQTFFYIFLICLAYFIARWYQFKLNRKILLLFLLLTSCFLLLAAVQWIPTLQFINLSARNIDMNWHQEGWFIPWQNLLQFIAPDFFGNPATNNYWGVWNYSEFVGYIGILPLLLSTFALFFRKDKKTLFFGTIFFISLFFALPTVFAQLPFILNIPFLSTSQPTRLLFVTDFSLAVLAALGLDYFIRNTNMSLRGTKPGSRRYPAKQSHEGQYRLSITGLPHPAQTGFAMTEENRGMFYVIGFFFIIFAGMWSVVFFNTKLHFIAVENLSVTKHNLVLPTILFIISTVLLITGAIAGKDLPTSPAGLQSLPKRFGISPNWAKYLPAGRQGFLPLLFLLLTTFDLFRFSSKYETFASGTFLFPSTSVLSYLQQHAGYYRIMATDSRTFPPNFPIMYKLQSVDGYDPLYLLRYAELIVASERGKPDMHRPFGFNRIITPENYNSPIINVLGVKYVLSLSDIKNSNVLKRVYIDAQTQIYENTHVLPRAFFVSQVTSVQTKQEVLNKLFDKQVDLSKQAVIEWGAGSRFLLPFSIGIANITSYSANKVIIQTNTTGEGFLVFTDIYYPTWHAAIDGKETNIYLTDYTFRGIIVPKGKHVITFSDHIF